jgi:hypothetical protein
VGIHLLYAKAPEDVPPSASNPPPTRQAADRLGWKPCVTHVTFIE